VGSGPEENKLKALAKELGVEKNVAFEGWKEDLHSYYKTANTYIQTSRFEGYGMSLVEAGLAGLPIVTTKVGVAGDFENGKEAYICPFGSTQEQVGWFANAIADLIDNNQHRENLRINMKNFLERTLLPKKEYLSQLKKNWEETAGSVSSKK
jgi:glycosyltransferase involved in cell wall biosynthesis